MKTDFTIKQLAKLADEELFEIYELGYIHDDNELNEKLEKIIGHETVSFQKLDPRIFFDSFINNKDVGPIITFRRKYKKMFAYIKETFRDIQVIQVGLITKQVFIIEFRQENSCIAVRICYDV